MELKKGDKKWEKEEMKWKNAEINYENAMAYNKKLANLILKVRIIIYITIYTNIHNVSLSIHTVVLVPHS